MGEGECKRKKHGAGYRRQWRKVHQGMDANTLESRAIEVTDNSVGERVKARTWERQGVELHVRVALLNRFTQLERPTTVSVAAMA